ncbi:SEC-C domain-containing protein [Streptosporangium sp. NPDC049046]|uniref:SEC-C domain-containing protein n=1 Tax=Streptosporangium sp. NPDC049046 TaxID=3155031 RepID=UPI00341F6A89
MTELDIASALGRARLQRVAEGMSLLRATAEKLPREASWVLHLPVPLQSKEPRAADQELTRRLPSTGTWFYGVRYNKEGNRSGLATPFLQLPEPYSLEGIATQLTMLDVHGRMGAWWLTHVWRGLQLADAAENALRVWQILPAAACARSLLEGAAAFSCESRDMIGDWDGFKRGGTPTLDTIRNFAEPFGQRLARVQFGSRLDESVETKPPIQSTNAITYVRRLTKKRPSDKIYDAYEWLCDAVHPSFGGMTVFVANQAQHFTDTHRLTQIARNPLTHPSYEPVIEPTVAIATADAIAVAADEIAARSAEMKWLIDDIGLTTKVASTSRLPDHVGAQPEPRRNDRCPCGSGRKYKSCGLHRWGEPGKPPPQ